MKRIASLIFGALLCVWMISPAAKAQQADASINLEASKSQANFGEEITVSVNVQNPGSQSIISARSWLEYNPNALEVISIDTSPSPFTLAAPGEDKAEPSENLIKMGYSNISGGMSESEAVLANIRFRINTQTPTVTSIRPHDYKVDQSGHTSLNIIDAGLPLNVLSGEPQTLLITLNGGVGNVGGNDGSQTTNQNNGQNQEDQELGRPQNLRLNIGDSTAELRWDMGKEPQLSGYYLYYGKTSGFYTRRIDVGLTNETFLDDLENGQAYYFAVTAYDGSKNESDYSDEVAGIIGEPGSSTAPFEDLLALLLAQLPSQPENGPMAWWMIISSFFFAWIWFRHKKRRELKITS